MRIYDLTLVVEHTGKRIPVEEVEGSVTPKELLDAVAHRCNLPTGTNSVLIHFNNRLLPSQTITEAGIKDGELIIARHASGIHMWDDSFQSAANRQGPDMRADSLLSIRVQFNNEIVSVKDLDGLCTVRDLVERLSSSLSIPSHYSLVLFRSLRRQLLPHQALEANVHSGDTLLVDFERTAGGSLEFYPSGRIKSIQTEPEETPYLSEILHEISGLHQIVENLEQRLAIVTAEIRDIQDSIVIVSGQDGASEMHMEPTNINKSGEPGIDSE